MIPFTLKAALAGTVLALGLTLAGHEARAESTPVKFTLDWKFEGPAAPFLVAAEKGYFADEGIEITIDSGNGSAGAVSRVASGAYDIAMADINSMIEFDASNPDQNLQAVFIVYDVPPFAIFAMKGSGIETPADLTGKTLGAPIFDAPRKLFPAFAQAVGLDAGSVTWETMDPPLREPMLVRGDVDAISGFYFTSLLNLRRQGVWEDDLVIFTYGDAGLDLYGNALIPSPALMNEKPEVLKGFLRAVVKGWRDVIADPEAGIEAVKRRDPLIDPALELERLKMAIAISVLTEDVKAYGMGGVRPERLQRAIDQVALAFGIADKPTPAEVFNDALLPPASERMLQ